MNNIVFTPNPTGFTLPKWNLVFSGTVADKAFAGDEVVSAKTYEKAVEDFEAMNPGCKVTRGFKVKD